MRALDLLVRILPGRHLPATPPDVAFRRPWPGTRRGLRLWMLAVIIGIKGVGYVIADYSAITDAALALPLLVAPLWVWGVMITGTCAFAAFMAYCHHGRDRYGYQALAGFAWLWAGCYFGSWVALDGPGAAVQGVTTWSLIGVFALYCSADPDITAPLAETPRACGPQDGSDR